MGAGGPGVPPPLGGGGGGSVEASEALPGDQARALPLGPAAHRAAAPASTDVDAAAAGCGRAKAGDPGSSLAAHMAPCATSTPVRSAEAPRPRHSCPGGIQTAEPLEALTWPGSAPLGVDSISGPSSLAGGGGGGGGDALLLAAAAMAAAGAASSAPPALSLTALGLAGSLGKVDSGQLLVSPSAAAATLAPESSVASSESGLSPAMRRACGPGPLLAVSPPPVRPRNASGDSASTPLSSAAAAGKDLASGGELSASPPAPAAAASLAAEGVGALLDLPPGLDADTTAWQSDQSRQQPSRHDLKLLQAALQQQQQQQQQQALLQQGGQAYGAGLAQQSQLTDLPAAMAALGMGAAAPQAFVGGEAPGQSISSGWQAAAASAAIQAQLTQQKALAEAVSAYAQAQAQAAVQAQMQQVALERRVLELQALQSQQQQQQQMLAAAQAAQQLQGQPFSAWQSLAVAQQQQQAGLLGPDILSSSSLLGALGLAAAAGGAGRRGGGRQSEGAGGRDTRRPLDKGPPAPAPRPPPRSRDEPPDFRRIFIGNIGWWVDEEMLRQSFDRFGTIIDVQIMWNTKMRGKGKKVNREFGFLSFSTPEEAATAIRWMHGAVLEGLTKDGDGLTVQYEAQGTSKPAGSSAASAAVAAAAQAALRGAPSPVHAAGLLQQQLQQQLHAQQVQGLSMAGALPPLGLALGGVPQSAAVPPYGGPSQPLALQLSQPRLADVRPQAPSATSAAQQLMAAAAAAAAAASGAPPPPLI